MKKILLAVLVLAVGVLDTQPLRAHVLVTDTTKTRGAILHITPDDDPIAGQRASFFFDIQGQQSAYAEGDVSLSIENALGEKTDVAIDLSGTLAGAEYVFPAKGIYRLVFTVSSGQKTYSFEHTQRITRGTAGSADESTHYTWAEPLLLTSVLGFAVLAIVAFNRRKAIAAHSHF